MKTNFDVWKEGLTAELAQDIFAGHLNGDPCRHCPAIDFCGKNFDGCKETFTAWANAKAERTTPRRRTEREIWKAMASMTTKELYEAFSSSRGASNKEATK